MRRKWIYSNTQEEIPQGRRFQTYLPNIMQNNKQSEIGLHRPYKILNHPNKPLLHAVMKPKQYKSPTKMILKLQYENILNFKMSNIQTYTKIASLCCGGLIVAMAITRFMNMNFSQFQTFILTIHYIWLGGVLVLSEFKFGYVETKFRLLTSYCGRGAYCIFLGTLMITNDNSFQVAVAIILFIAGIGYFILQMLSKKYGWETGSKNPYEIPKQQNAQQPYVPNYAPGGNFQPGAPALK